MATCVVSSKGQITVPFEVREQLGLNIGDRLVFTKIEGTNRYELTRKTRPAKSLVGMFKSDKPAPTLDRIDEAIGEQIAIENDLG